MLLYASSQGWSPSAIRREESWEIFGRLWSFGVMHGFCFVHGFWPERWRGCHSIACRARSAQSYCDIVLQAATFATLIALCITRLQHERALL